MVHSLSLFLSHPRVCCCAMSAPGEESVSYAPYFSLFLSLHIHLSLGLGLGFLSLPRLSHLSSSFCFYAPKYPNLQSLPLISIPFCSSSNLWLQSVFSGAYSTDISPLILPSPV
ncbi:hypothetical protein Droror1_Dr00017943 [Drosera rotundifolia]